MYFNFNSTSFSKLVLNLRNTTQKGIFNTPLHLNDFYVLCKNYKQKTIIFLLIFSLDHLIECRMYTVFILISAGQIYEGTGGNRNYR